jgi:hypothetical protein
MLGGFPSVCKSDTQVVMGIPLIGYIRGVLCNDVAAAAAAAAYS